jgi:hypothetical protein
MDDFLKTVVDKIRNEADDLPGDLAAVMVIMVDKFGTASPMMFASGDEGVALARGCIDSATEHLHELMEDEPRWSDFDGTMH